MIRGHKEACLIAFPLQKKIRLEPVQFSSKEKVEKGSIFDKSVGDKPIMCKQKKVFLYRIPIYNVKHN